MMQKDMEVTIPTADRFTLTVCFDNGESVGFECERFDMSSKANWKGVWHCRNTVTNVTKLHNSREKMFHRIYREAFAGRVA